MKTVYWSHFCEPSSLPRIMLLNSKPEKFNDTFRKNMTIEPYVGSYSLCPAGMNFWSNTYQISFGKDFDLTLDEDGNVINNDGFCLFRSKQFYNRLSLEIDLGWIFYSETSLIMEILPAFYHKTKASEYGTIVSGSFDIGQWFRPVTMSFFLWENENKFIAKEGEPFCYIRFITEEKVELKQFTMDEKTWQISNSCVTHKDYYKNKLPLHKKYKKFKESDLPTLLMNNIKSNLL